MEFKPTPRFSSPRSTWNVLLKSCVFGLLSMPLFLGAQTLERWSDPATWGGTVPGAGATVIVPAGKTVLLDVNPPVLQGIQVMGKLEFDTVDIDLNLGYILVMGGEFRIGTAADPYAKKAVITFIGDTADATGMGLVNKFLMVMGGGNLALHRHRKEAVAWTQLRRNAIIGHKTVETDQSVNWRIGDQFVLAPSGCRGERAEVRTITKVLGHKIQFTPALNFHHYGKVDTIQGHVVDMRAEIGLLTRDIVLRGDLASETTQRGGHVMIMNGSTAKVEGTEFYRMGWYGEAGRYPMHWHFSGDSYGEYARNNSVHRSFHRAFVVHGTNGVQVADNVAYDITSHAYVIAEEGMEIRNEFLRNLGVYTHRIPDMADFAFPSTDFSSSQSERHPGTFWQTNPNNIVRDNRAAGGVDAIGFFYDGNGTAADLPVNFFSGNVAHSYFSNEGGYDRAFYRTTGWGLFVGPGLHPDVNMVFRDFLAYKNTMGGAWLEGYGVVLKNSILADNGTGVNLHASALKDVVIIDETPNILSSSTKSHGAINVFSNFPLGTKEPKIVDVEIVGGNQGINIETKEVDVASFMRHVTFTATTGGHIRLESADFQGAMVDLKGQVSGSGIAQLYMGRNYLLTLPSCTNDTAAFSTVCPLKDYASLEITSPVYTSGLVGNVRLDRINGIQSMSMFDARLIDSWLPEFGHRQTQWIPKAESFEVVFLDETMPQLFDVSLTGYAEAENVLLFMVPVGYRPVVFYADGSTLLPAASSASLAPAADAWYFDEVSRQFTMQMHVDLAEDLQKVLQVRLVPAREAASFAPSAGAVALPNPFQDELRIRYTLPYDRMRTELRLLAPDGRTVYQDLPRVQDAGQYDVVIPAQNLAPGLYRYVLRTGTKTFEGAVLKATP